MPSDRASGDTTHGHAAGTLVFDRQILIKALCCQAASICTPNVLRKLHTIW